MGMLLFGVFQFKGQATDLQQFLTSPDRSQAIANYLKQQYESDPSLRIFCDHPEVRVVSGIPRGHFYDSFRAPKDNKGFIAYLRANGIKFLVIPKEQETSTPSQLFPNLVKENADAFEGIIPAPDDQRDDSLYKVLPEKPAPSG